MDLTLGLSIMLRILYSLVKNSKQFSKNFIFVLDKKEKFMVLAHVYSALNQIFIRNLGLLKDPTIFKMDGDLSIGIG